MTDPLEAGRDLDALIWEKVLGKKTWRDGGTIFAGPPTSHPDTWTVPFYSTEIVAAWMIVEHIVGQGAYVLVEGPANGLVHNGWHCVITPNRDLSAEVDAWAATAPLAICRAALEAVGVPTP